MPSTKRQLSKSAAKKFNRVGADRDNVAVYLGDSLVSNGSYVNGAQDFRRNPRSILQHAMRRLGRPVNIVNEVGFSGKRTDEVFAEWDTQVTPYDPGRVFWLTGNNDIFQGGTGKLAFARIMKVRDRCEQEGRILSVLPVAPSTQAEGQTLMRMLHDRARKDPVIEVIGSMHRSLDYNQTPANLASGISLANMFTEGNTHPTAQCANLVATSIVEYYTKAGVPGRAKHFGAFLAHPGGNNPAQGDCAANMLYNGLVGSGSTYGAGWSSQNVPAGSRVGTPSTVPMGSAGLQDGMPGRLQQIVWTPGTAPAAGDLMKTQNVWDVSSGAAQYAGKTFKGSALVKVTSTGGAIQVVSLSVTLFDYSWNPILGVSDNGCVDTSTLSVWGLNTTSYEGLFETPEFKVPTAWGTPGALHVVTEVTVMADPGATVTVQVGCAEIAQVGF